MSGRVLIVTPHHERYARELRQQAPEIETAGCATGADAPRDLSPFDTALAWRLEPALVARWPALRWIQTVSAGADHLFALPELDPGVVVTSVRGIHARPIASYAMMMMTALSMGLGAMLENQRAGRWKPWGWNDLEGRTLCQVGMGAIGCEIAQRARACGMRVLGVKRTAGGGEEHYPADEIFPAEGLDQALGEADFTVLAVPLTPMTRGLFGPGRFARMKEGAFLVNVARGEVVDVAGLLAALEEGRLAGAALDVFAEEPLPADSPLWRHEGVLITPHVAGLTRDYISRVCRIFADNWRRRQAGEPLTRVVDRGRGY